MTPADRPLKFRFTAGLLLAATTALAAAALPSLGHAAAQDGPLGPQPYARAFGLRTSLTTLPNGPLSDADARAYAAAFDAVKAGQFDLADSIAQSVQDPSLQGRLQYDKLMHSAYHASYGELKVWLDRHRDEPGADRIFALAKKREKETLSSGAAVTSAADTDQDTALAVPVSAQSPQQMAREAYYGGDVNTAYRLATSSGERWVAGMAAFRLGKFDEAFRWLSDLSQDEAQSEWIRSGAAWWAARSAATAGRGEDAATYLKLAALTPYTFYGLIAAHQLGLDTATTLAPTVDTATPSSPQPFQRAIDVQVKPTAAVLELEQTDPSARRAAALVQVGAKADAALELRAAMLKATDGEARKTWKMLAEVLSVPLTSPAETRRAATAFDPSKFEAPALAPTGGYTLEKSLVYAIVRQESRFNASAVSPAGAQGLMQLMPATAHLLGWTPPAPPPRRRHRHQAVVQPPTLRTPGENLRLGQAYVAKILDAVHGDLIRAVASYNSGPGTILKTAARLGEDVDSLLLLESTPGAETRDYVQKVMSNYWIYRKLWGLPSPTLDAVASGASRVPAMMDANKGHGAKLTSG